MEFRKALFELILGSYDRH